MNFYKKIFALFLITSMASSIYADAKTDFERAIKKNDKVAALNAAKILVTTYGKYSDAIDSFREEFNGQYKKNYADLYDDFDYLTGVMIDKNIDGQQAIDYAQNQETTKGGDPAALKACNDSLTTCTATVRNYATEGTKLQNASSAFYGHTSTPNNYIAGYVQAFIKYADGTDVYKDMAGKELFEGKKWLENYFNPTTCILPALTDFYDQILSAITTNKQDLATQWNIKLDLTPTNTSISDNMNNLITRLNTLNPAQKTCPENDCSKCPTDYSSIKNAFTKDHTYELTFVSELNNPITNRNNANYLKDSGDYPAYINNMINLIESVTDKLFANDLNYKNKEQLWFDKHIIATTQTTRDTGILNLKDTINTQLDAALAAQNNTQPASSKIDSGALTALDNLEITIKSLIEDLDPDIETSNIYDVTQATSLPLGNNYKTTQDAFNGGATAVYNKISTHANNIVSQLKAVYAQLDSKDKPSDLDSIPTIGQL